MEAVVGVRYGDTPKDRVNGADFAMRASRTLFWSQTTQERLGYEPTFLPLASPQPPPGAGRRAQRRCGRAARRGRHA